MQISTKIECLWSSEGGLGSSLLGAVIIDKEESWGSGDEVFFGDVTFSILVENSKYLHMDYLANEDSSYPVGMKCLFIPRYVSIMHRATDGG